ncbi:glycosyltransferase [Aeromicrobium sp.]|uniref:glycosyltransferase n=1 Tax=Aeromicrobium sp. TaxID=1871063 RepID=UPI0019ABC874|nr:glycosyltransferase [Aeromicrobium sp.]MBC7633656.1 glycosyltransferase [Aeromicrobium sp.]
MPRREVDTIVVVIPAHNEESNIARALAGVRRAIVPLARSVDVEVVVVVNGGIDRTAEIVRQEGAHLLVSDIADVGAARSTGCRWALLRFASRLDRLWIATTDADSLVPRHWLAEHLGAAEGGADVVLGTVVLAPHEARRHRGWAETYAQDAARRRHHGHVHGANMGIRARRYLEVGGFRAMAAREDVDLVERLRSASARIAWLSHVPVLTSARHDNRVVAGVGNDLAASM